MTLRDALTWAAGFFEGEGFVLPRLENDGLRDNTQRAKFFA